jgi:hypothetical protein
MGQRVNWNKVRIPPALQERLQELLDRQDRERKLTARERRGAAALIEHDVLTLVKLEAKQANRRKKA